METNTNYLSELTNKLKTNLPSTERIQSIVKENDEIVSIAAGTFLAVIGLKFISKTVGFLAFAGGAALLYRTATANRNVKEVLDKIASPETERTVSPKIYADTI